MTYHRRTVPLHVPRDAAAALVESPPDLPGWDTIGPGELVDDTTVRYVYEDDDGAEACLTIHVDALEVDTSRVRPDPVDHDGARHLRGMRDDD